MWWCAFLSEHAIDSINAYISHQLDTLYTSQIAVLIVYREKGRHFFLTFLSYLSSVVVVVVVLHEMNCMVCQHSTAQQNKRSATYD